MSKRELTRKPSKADFNKQTDSSDSNTKRGKANVHQWSMQQLLFWLESNKMKWVKPVFKDEDANKKYIRLETNMFQKSSVLNNEIVIRGGPSDKLVALVSLPDDASLRMIWSEGDSFPSDFFMIFYGFMSPKDLLETLKKRYIFIPQPEVDSEDEDGGEEEEIPKGVYPEGPSVVNAFKSWISAENALDFELDAELVKNYNEFCDGTIINKEHGKEFLMDGKDETSWNSDQGENQWISIDFQRTVIVNEVRIQFQGGFSAKSVEMACFRENQEGTMPMDPQTLYPEDINCLQYFTIKGNPVESNSIKLMFNDLTDFFGRIIIYRLELLGTKL